MRAAHDISKTAFVINVSRARREDVSLDVYARLWVTPEATALWEDLARDVYPDDDMSSSLRNRFYLERLRAFAARWERPACINVAAGFSMYPYLVESPARFVEIDYPHIVDYKRRRLAAWEEADVLPRREVAFFGADLSRPDDVEALGRALPGWAGREGTPAMVIMEGITYYLARPVLDRLFALFAAHLPADSLVAFERWPTDAADYPVFVRLENYLTARFGWASHGYTLLDAADVAAIPGFAVQESMDMAQAERIWSGTGLLADRSQRLPIFFTVLRKT
ncbi:hypothetical protein G3N56_08375 [Desulfovibrio sulfodismutans]|uniref:Class I SAM-dependent methyltransferase n=1 Tax=Desulfolutivibrio sulfodismutans TaxID=63561 RepID=A0A7K3NKM3_9BACT|nr:class I SAM-dependent methyltransferase [Desulfolutivibrio sulfodismutans]NDY56758.1 hypothetical protein [Desulfolutivibrio sulfodismutans]QLA13302.1 hypothetical protein GD606_14045 [Desulfolutivibrio sulfodismutans DSM 3696]